VIAPTEKAARGPTPSAILCTRDVLKFYRTGWAPLDGGELAAVDCSNSELPAALAGRSATLNAQVGARSTRHFENGACAGSGPARQWRRRGYRHFRSSRTCAFAGAGTCRSPADSQAFNQAHETERQQEGAAQLPGAEGAAGRRRKRRCAATSRFASPPSVTVMLPRRQNRKARGAGAGPMGEGRWGRGRGNRIFADRRLQAADSGDSFAFYRSMASLPRPGPAGRE